MINVYPFPVGLLGSTNGVCCVNIYNLFFGIREILLLPMKTINLRDILVFQYCMDMVYAQTSYFSGTVNDLPVTINFEFISISCSVTPAATF